uniref:recombinase family protein n=1 Tax=Polaromonas sp. TaxID=1869339 RepID=UPI00159A1B0E|nr:recombinase family protein [Polaromonas sp.]QJS06516.1 resolvase [Polaromonas sp.]
MRQAIGYIRVSTDKQVNEGVSLEAQEAKIVSWCKTNDYELVKIYVDAGISGKRMDTRKELLAALASLKKGMALVSYSLSRLARSTKDALAIGEAVAKKKADMVSLTEQIDTTTAAGKMMFQMLSVLAEFERNLVAERTTNALQHKKRAGQKYTNQTPYGFEAIEGRLVQVQQEAEVVGEIQTARSSGKTLQSIADHLNGRSIPTKTGKQWTPATIHLLLRRTSLIDPRERSIATSEGQCVLDAS